MVGGLSPEEREGLQAVIAGAETQTSAEIVVAVADASDEYRIYPLFWGAAVGVLAIGVIALVWPALPIRMAFVMTVVTTIASWLILHVRPLHLHLVPHDVKQRAASGMALAEFAERVAGRTRELNGLLLFISFAERYVAIVPDSGIKRLIPESQWHAVVATLLEALQHGQTKEGLAAAISACTEILKTPFPPRPDDREELDNSVVVVKD